MSVGNPESMIVGGALSRWFRTSSVFTLLLLKEITQALVSFRDGCTLCAGVRGPRWTATDSTPDFKRRHGPSPKQFLGFQLTTTRRTGWAFHGGCAHMQFGLSLFFRALHPRPRRDCRPQQMTPQHVPQVSGRGELCSPRLRFDYRP